MRVDWNTLKKFLNDTELFHFLNYIEFDNEVYVWILYQGETFSCILVSGSHEWEEFNTDYKSKAVLKNDIADDGIQFSKVNHVLMGRFLLATYVVFETSSKVTNDVTGFFTVKLFNDQGVETDVEADAVKTCLDFGPNYAYEVQSGVIQATTISLNGEIFQASAILAPDIPVESGGSKYFARNRRIFSTDSYVVEAVGPGKIAYNSTIPINVLRIELIHNKGIQQEFQCELKIYT